MEKLPIITLLLIGVGASITKKSNPTKIQDLSRDDLEIVQIFQNLGGQAQKNVKLREADALKWNELSRRSSRDIEISFLAPTVEFGKIIANSKVGTVEQRQEIKQLTKQLKSQKKLLDTPDIKTKELKPFFSTLIEIYDVYDEIGDSYPEKEINRLREEYKEKEKGME